MSSFCILSRSSSKTDESNKRKNKQLILQRHPMNHIELSEAPPIVHEVLHSSGQPIDTRTRSIMETRFGHDFSKVRIHTDDRAAESTRMINARAFIVGQDVVFGKGQYSPGTTEGKRLLAHELAHVLPQTGTQTFNPTIQMQEEMRSRADSEPEKSATARQDVVIIVGRPSGKLKSRETPKEREEMTAWRAAARALTPNVLEGLTVDKALTGLQKYKVHIGKLYIICHADVSGIGEVSTSGVAVSTTLEDLTKRIKAATGSLGNRAPQSIEMLSCYGGGSPKTMGKIGQALGASTVRAPVRETVISGIVMKLGSGSKATRLTIARIHRLGLSDDTLIVYIKQTDALKYYDFVPGVPHPQSTPSSADKLTALVGVLRTTGMIPFVSYNAPPGERDAVPYWRAPVQRRQATDVLTPEERNMQYLSGKGLIEVTVPEKE